MHGQLSSRRVLLSRADSVLDGQVKLLWDGSDPDPGLETADDVFDLGMLLCEAAAGGAAACRGIDSVEELLQQVRPWSGRIITV